MTTLTKTSLPETSRERQSQVLPVALLSKAETLFSDGYRAQTWYDNIFRVTSPRGDVYLVDARNHTCECASFRRRLYTDAAGRATCKHREGLKELANGMISLLDEQIGRAMEKQVQKEMALTPWQSERDIRRQLNGANLPERVQLWQSESDALFSFYMAVTR